MGQAKRSGGPKTVQGKARSSKNATSHGLTSMSPRNPNEKTLVTAYIDELANYYQPQSPLERLQIERIATCRAKLAYLNDLEQVKLALAVKELESQPETILKTIPGASGLALGMAKASIASGAIYFPCRLDLPLLEAICHEIEQLHGVLENKHQFARALPKLTKYLNAYPVVGLNNTDQWMEKLMAVSKDLDMAFAIGDQHAGEWDEFIQTYLVGRKYLDQLGKESMKSAMDELDRYQEEVRIRYGQKPSKIELATPNPDAISDLPTVLKHLQKFLSLHESYQQAQQLLLQYPETKELMLRAISLPVAESDLFMRYQTTLERRLSSAIGELLALQRASKPDAGA